MASYEGQERIHGLNDRLDRLIHRLKHRNTNESAEMYEQRLKAALEAAEQAKTHVQQVFGEKLRDLSAKLENEANQNAILNQNNKRLTHDLNARNAEAYKKDALIKDLSAQVERYKDLSETANKLTVDNADLANSLDEERTRASLLAAEANKLKAQNSQFSCAIEIKSAELDRLKKLLASDAGVEERVRNEFTAKLNEETARMQEQHAAELESLKNSMAERLNTIREQLLSEQELLKAELAEAQKDIKARQALERSLNDKILALNKKLQEADAALNDAETAKAHAVDDLEHSRGEYQKLILKCEGLHKKWEEGVNQIQALGKREEELLVKQDELRAHLAGFQRENRKLAGDVMAHEGSIAALRATLDESDRTIRKLQENVKGSHEQIIKKSTRITELDTSLVNVRKDLTSEQAKTVKLTAEIRRYEQLLGIAEEEVGIKAQARSVRQKTGPNPCISFKVDEENCVTLKNETGEERSLGGAVLFNELDQNKFTLPEEITLGPQQSVTVWITKRNKPRANKPNQLFWENGPTRVISNLVCSLEDGTQLFPYTEANRRKDVISQLYEEASSTQGDKCAIM